MAHDQSNLLLDAFNAYLNYLHEAELEPTETYLPYEFGSVDSRQWTLLGKEMVKDELHEITNKFNYWHYSLTRWHAWNIVITNYSDEDAWNLRREFLESLAHHCLLMPSSIRDTLTFVATNSIHQVILATKMECWDYLDGDPRSPSDKPKFLTRRKKENRLNKLVLQWSTGSDFMSALKGVDDKVYRKLTSNYRHFNSHSIGPRLGVGMTRAVVRSVEQATTMSKQADGTYLPTPVPGKMSVSYGFGGTEPLDMEAVRIANLEQYHQARNCFFKYRTLLDSCLEDMPLIQPEN